ncbi:MAG: twin-arginine translocase subunit TatC [Candidatus Omnitrophica bacterium]|nr:twin-arginine translocase subunit TatC [Candidatus Omnitrophota bacterium]
MPNSDPSNSIWDHIEELRVRVIKSLLGMIVGAFIFYSFVDHVMFLIVKPVGRLVFTSPADAFVARMLLTLLGGFVIALPVILYQVWSFIALGLRDEEKKYAALYGPLSLIFFLMGVCFAYFVALPMSLYFLLGFSSDWLVPMITVNNYVSFFITMVFAFGIIFELPVVLIFLTAIGIATPEFLIQKRRVAIILILIISAIVTPPDVISLIIMSIPMVVLYELGVLASKWTYARKLARV